MTDEQARRKQSALLIHPLIDMQFQHEQCMAAGTSLAAVVATGSGGALSYATAAGAVDWEVSPSASQRLERLKMRSDPVDLSIQ